MTTAIKLNYVSVERFLSDYTQLCNGKIFIPATYSLPEKTSLILQIVVPAIDQVVPVKGRVLEAAGLPEGLTQKPSAGMLIGLTPDPPTALDKLKKVLSADKDYRELLDLPPLPPGQSIASPSGTRAAQESAPVSGNENEHGLSMGWIREAIAQEEATREREVAAYVAKKPASEKKKLTEEETACVKPAGEFIMDLTKAMLRSGYYSPDHPGSQDAKRGLYESLQQSGPFDYRHWVHADDFRMRRAGRGDPRFRRYPGPQKKRHFRHLLVNRSC